ncbi:hypothetical protein ACNPM8_01225 [Glutamicibacter sp. AGC46]
MSPVANRPSHRPNCTSIGSWQAELLCVGLHRCLVGGPDVHAGAQQGPHGVPGGNEGDQEYREG